MTIRRKSGIAGQSIESLEPLVLMSATAIDGTDAGEWISGTEADDAISAGGGDDEIYAPIGDNQIDGGDGFDTLVIYEGKMSDYTVETSDDGMTVVEGPGLNGELVRNEITNVERIVFNDGAVRLNSALESGSVINGTDGNDWISGTSDNDLIDAGAGDDEIHAPVGHNVIDGGDGEDTLVIYEGNRDDFTITKADDGSIIVEGPGLDGPVMNVLTNVENIQFNDGVVMTDSIDGGGDSELTAITLRAKGATGDEQMTLMIDGEVVETFNVSNVDEDYTFQAADGVTIDRISVGFVGDLVDEASGYNRALTVDHVAVDGEIFETESRVTFGDGVEVDGQIQSGYHETETLETDGEFRYATQKDVDRRNFMMFGDTTLNRIVTINIDTMEELGDLELDAQNVYATGNVGLDKVYSMNRGSDFMTVMERNEDTGEYEETGEIDVGFGARTTAHNEDLGLVVISGVDKPMWALIDDQTNEVVMSGGRDEVTNGTMSDYGGSNATGHSEWVSENQFTVTDREARTIELFQVEKVDGSWVVTSQDVLDMPTSIHTVENMGDNILYAVIEGAPSEGIPAGLAKITLNGDSLELTDTFSVPGDASISGGHHVSEHPTQNVVYVPDTSGAVYVVDRDTFEVVETIDAGKGAGHVVMVPQQNYALIINHRDTFLTVVDLETNTKVKDIQVATDDPDHDAILQAHTGRVSLDGQYFYSFATDSGMFYRLNLDTLEIDGTIDTGGTPHQAAAMA